MYPLLRSRRLIWIALFAWLAQLCLPAAHAAAMADRASGMAVWCGAESPGIRAQLAKLDAEVREILEQGAAQADQHADCAMFCASTPGTDPVVEPISVRLRAAGLEPAVRFPVAAPRDAAAPTPPVRGPPVAS